MPARDRANGSELSLAQLIAASIRVVDLTAEASKRKQVNFAVRGPLEDAVISLHEARRTLEQIER